MKNIVVTSLTTLALALTLNACGKKDEKVAKPAPQAAPARRAIHVRNLEINSKLADYIATQGIKNGLCAQLVTLNEGTSKGKTVMEISQGPCPANSEVADPKKGIVEVYELGDVSNGNNWSQYLPEGDDLIAFGEVLYQHGEIAKKLPYRLNDLCSQNSTINYSDNCFFASPVDGKFQGTWYWPEE